MPSRLSGIQRRDQILACARYVFARAGYDGARTAEIAERAGVSERLLYKHFVGKRELFIAVTKDTARRVVDGYRTLADDAPDLESAIHELYYGRLGPGQFRSRTQGLFFARSHGPFEDPDLDAAVGAAYRSLATAATQFFRRMVERGLAREDLDAEAAAWILSGILVQHDALWTAHPTRRAVSVERRVLHEYVNAMLPGGTS